MRMNTILVINRKGGVGKTTITTNLASYFAVNNIPTTIMDYDPQGSSLHWLGKRSPLGTTIHGANAAQPIGGGLRSIRMHVPTDTQRLIMDAPAGASRLLLQEMLGKANCIVIPVAPSSLDIHATANFIKELLLVGRIRSCNIRLAVVANRVRNARSVYKPLERFLSSLGMPLLTQISESEVYIEAAENGVGVFEMDADVSATQRQEFMPIVNWVQYGALPGQPALASVIALPPRTRAFPH